jgi:hypothetical protein
VNSPAFDFSCQLSASAQYLSIDYSLRNRGAVGIGLFNQITGVRIDGAIETSPDLAYIELEGGTLVISKLALPIPAGLHIAAYVPPFASSLAPGQTFSERVRVFLPARVTQPFRRALVRGQVVADKPAQARSLRFALGVFTLEDSLQLISENPAWPKLLTAFPPGKAVPRQQVLTKEFELQTAVPVLDYRGAPWT